MKIHHFLLCLLTNISIVYALPQGEQVVNGAANFQRNGGNIVIRPSNNAIIEYSSFNIAKNESVNFLQNKNTDRVLNRVNGFTPSYIDGNLTSNGAVYLVNQAGIFFGKTAVVNVGMLFAAAAKMSNTDFLNNVNHFTDISSRIINEGSITGGKLGFIANEIVNKGLIKAVDGFVALSTNDRFFLADKSEDIFIDITHFSTGKIENSGEITSNNDTVFIGAQDVYALASSKLKGQIVALNARKSLNISGNIETQDGLAGGTIYALANTIKTTNANINSNGQKGGGEIYIGGDIRGTGKLPKAYTTSLDINTSINANALNRGDGGKIIVWSESSTICKAQISATGGSFSGNGGFVETSSHKDLDINGCNIYLLAPHGKIGQWLIDPTNIYIASYDYDPASLADVNAFNKPNKGEDGTTINADLLNTAVAAILLEAQNNIEFKEGAHITLSQPLTAYAGGNITVNSTIQAANTITFVANSSLSPTQSGSGSIFINKSIGSGPADINFSIDGGSGNLIISDSINLSDIGGGDISLLISNGSGELIVEKSIYTSNGNININVDDGSAHITINDPVTTDLGEINITTTNNNTGAIDIKDMVTTNDGSIEISKITGSGDIIVHNGPITASGDSEIYADQATGSISIEDTLIGNLADWSIYALNGDVDITIAGNIIAPNFTLGNTGDGSVTVAITSSTGGSINSIQQVLDAIFNFPSISTPKSIKLLLLGNIFAERVHISLDNVDISRFGNVNRPLISNGIVFDADVSDTTLNSIRLTSATENHIIDLNSHTITNFTATGCEFSANAINQTCIGNGTISGNFVINSRSSFDCLSLYSINLTCAAGETNIFITNSTISGNGPTGTLQITGNTLSNIIIEDSQFSDNYLNYIDTFKTATITGNTFINEEDISSAITFQDVDTLSFTENIIETCESGLYITGTTNSATVLKNDFLLNNNFDISVDAIGNPVNISGNYFGSTDQPTAPQIQGNITFSSWLGVPHASVPLIWYTNSTIGTPPRTNIQSTLDLANSGDYINIAGGNYNENVVVLKQVTLYFPTNPNDFCGVDSLTGVAPLSIDGFCQSNISGFTFFAPVIVVNNLTLNAPNQDIYFANTLDARWYPGRSGGCNMTLSANTLLALNFVGKITPFNIIDVSSIACDHIQRKEFFVGYNKIISACPFPWPSSPQNPSNAINSNFGTLKIISSDEEVLNLINDAQQRYLEELQKKEAQEKEKEEHKNESK
jgi:filamentous hemagglutinin family protein